MSVSKIALFRVVCFGALLTASVPTSARAAGTPCATPVLSQSSVSQLKDAFGPVAGVIANFIGHVPADGIGNRDLAVMSHIGFSNTTINIYPGTGDGTYQASPISTPIAASVADMAGADFNGDGFTDLALGSYVSGHYAVQILLGRGDGTLAAQPLQYVDGTADLTSIAVADFNGDHKLDIVAAGYSNLSVLLGNGDGTFRPPLLSPSGAGRSVVVGDFDNDHRLDLAMAQLSSVIVQMGNGDGTFQAPRDF